MTLLRSALIRHPRSFAFAGSLLLSLLVVLQNDIINGDGIIYVNVAKAYLAGGVGDAFRVFNWPFYGILIGITHQLTLIDLEYSAHLLDAVLVASACAAFVAVYLELYPGTQHAWLAALLLLALPIVNEYRDFVIRDFGFWAFVLGALYFFLRFDRRRSLLDATLWQVALCLAIAFRIEGVAFALAPGIYYAFLCESDAKKRIRLAFQSSYLLISLAILAAVAGLVFSSSPGGVDLQILQRWISYASPLQIVSAINDNAEQLMLQLEYLSSSSDAAFVLVAGLLSLVAYKLALNAAPLFLLIAAYGSRKRWVAPSSSRRIIWVFLVLSVATIAALVMSRFFISSRYTVIATLLISLLTFGYVEAGLKRLAAGGKVAWQFVFWLLVASMLADSTISLGAGKTAIRDGSSYALERFDRNMDWLCNEPRLAFYTEGRCKVIDRDKLLAVLQRFNSLNEDTLLLLWISRKDTELTQLLQQSTDFTLVDSRKNRRNDMFAAYQSRPKAH
ncbi:MAG: hypothetical protein KDJ27_14015 [Gammaproteobacteria bacterium]|nr:hypothetical protein [Gammaproteobacteria bacterium]